MSAALRDRLERALIEGQGRDAQLSDESDLAGDDADLRDAAVLIAVTDRQEPGVILVQRPDYMRSHPGQVAFPGGGIEAGDADATAAALREAEEEVALDPARVDVIGPTDLYRSGSGFRIQPVLAVIPPDLPLVPCPTEVEAWFEVPLALLMDSANHLAKSGHWRGRDRRYYEIPFPGRRIWGITAGIIVNLSRRLAWPG